MTDASPFRVLADRLKDDWTLKARPSQLPPSGDWLVWLVLAGRGYGKTRCGSEYVRMMVESGQARNIALVAPTTADTRKVMIEGPSGLVSISPDWNRPIYEPTNRQLTWPNGATAVTYSAEEPERLRGPQHDLCWADEVGAWRNQQEAWDQIQFGLRLGALPRVVATTTPKPTPLIRELVKRAKAGLGVVITRGSTGENAANLAPSFLQEIVGRYGGTRLGRQELEAELLEDTPGALWSRKLIDDTRWTDAQWPALRRIVVGIDPATSSGEDADETGIIAAGVDHSGHGYILVDESGRYGPTEWARKAVALFHRLHADRIVVERNQGGAMCESTLRAVDASMPITTIHASRGKVARAEPVSAFFEQGRAHICGVMQALEDQLTSFAPGMTKSPDRLDAAVYALLELMDGSGTDGALEYMRRLAEDRGGPANTTEAESSDALRCYAPAPCTVQLITGRSVSIGVDRALDCTPAEAKPFRSLPGWTVPMEASDGR